MDQLLIATSNPGKLREFTQLLAGVPYHLVGLREAGITRDVAETGATFDENARMKAAAYASASGLLALADDSGLEVDALNGEPGVHSARYGGPGLTDEARVDLLLQNLAGVPKERRTARFVCVIALAGPAGVLHVVRGLVEGRITRAPRGGNGFGYDPVFLVPRLGRTTAELDADAKNALSHRGQAARAAREYLLYLAHAP